MVNIRAVKINMTALNSKSMEQKKTKLSQKVIQCTL